MKKLCVELWNSIGQMENGKDIKKPTITYYRAENKKSNGAFVIFPGGGYSVLADYEGRGYAEFLNLNGIDAFVVEYRVAPNDFPLPLGGADIFLDCFMLLIQDYACTPQDSYSPAIV